MRGWDAPHPAGALVAYFRANGDGEDDATDLTHAAFGRLMDGGPADQRATLQAAVVAGTLLSQQSTRRARHPVASMLSTHVIGPTGATRVAPTDLVSTTAIYVAVHPASDRPGWIRKEHLAGRLDRPCGHYHQNVVVRLGGHPCAHASTGPKHGRGPRASRSGGQNRFRVDEPVFSSA